VIQSILTGNTRPAAEIKLRTFGLDPESTDEIAEFAGI
jgi:hypothetical protein